MQQDISLVDGLTPLARGLIALIVEVVEVIVAVVATPGLVQGIG